MSTINPMIQSTDFRKRLGSFANSYENVCYTCLARAQILRKYAFLINACRSSILTTCQKRIMAFMLHTFALHFVRKFCFRTHCYFLIRISLRNAVANAAAPKTAEIVTGLTSPLILFLFPFVAIFVVFPWNDGMTTECCLLCSESVMLTVTSCLRGRWLLPRVPQRSAISDVGWCPDLHCTTNIHSPWRQNVWCRWHSFVELDTSPVVQYGHHLWTL